MGHANDVQTTTGDMTTAARPEGDEAVRCDPPSVPRDNVDDANNGEGAMDLQAEEPGYGYGV